MKKALIIAVTSITVLLLSALLFLHFYMDGDRVAEYISNMAGSNYDIQISVVDFGLLSRTINLEDVSVQINHIEGETLFEADQISLNKIGLISALRGNVSVQSAELKNFYFNQSLMAEMSVEEGSDEEPTTEINIRTVSLENGEIKFKTGSGDEGNLSGLNLRFQNVDILPDEDFQNQIYDIENIELDIRELNYTFWDGRYKLVAESIAISEENQKAELGTLSLDSVPSIEEFYQTLKYRTDHFSVEMKGFTIHQPNFKKMLKGDTFTAGYISADSLNLHVTLDKRLPVDPDRSAQLPQNVLMNAANEISADSLVVSHADIRYSEIDEKGVRPGTITFAGTQAKISPINSDLSEPIVASATSLLEGSGELKADFHFSMDGDIAITHIVGSLGRFDVRNLNSIFEDLEGIRIESGTMYRADFDYTLRNRKSDGIFLVHYDEMSIGKIDRIDHDQNLGDRIASFFADQIALRSSSDNNGEDFREGEIDYENDPEKGFFNTVWVGLRSGIMDAIMRL